MAQIAIATVAAITGSGTVFAIDAQGVSRQLKVGDELQKGETIRTVGDARVELLMEDGHLLAIAPAQSVRLDENVVQSEQLPSAQDSAVTTPATADTVIQALERGTDLNQALDATAAGLGAGGGGGGSTFVQLLRITEGTDPLAYNYSFNSAGQLSATQPGATETTTTMQLSADAAVSEGGPGITYTATLGNPAITDMTITLSNGAVITIAAGATSGSAVVSVRPDDVYLDPQTLTTTVGTVQGGGFTTVTVNDANVITVVNDTITPVTVSLSASTGVLESGTAAYTFTATLSAASHGVTTVVTDHGTITIADGATTGTLVIAGPHGEDVYKDPTSLTATITSASGGNFEQLNVDATPATATIIDTITPVTVALSASTGVLESAAAYTFTATLSAASQGVTTVVTDHGTITIADGATTGTLVIAGPHGEDVYKDPTSLTATITSASGGNFEQLNVDATPATATIVDTITPVTVALSASTGVLESGTAAYTFTATLSAASHGPTTVVTDHGTITIADGATTGTLVIAGPHGEDVYKDPTSLTATIQSATGGNFEQLNVDATPATATIIDTITPVTVALSASTGVLESGTAAYTFTATLSAASHGDTTVVTDRGTITIADGATTGTLVIPGANTEDVYVDPTSLTATIQSATGGNFEQINVVATPATATIIDTITPVTVDIASSDAGAVEGAAHFTVNVSQALDRALSVTLSNGDSVTIAQGQTSANYTHAVPVGTNAAHTYTVGVSDATVVGATFEQLQLGHAASVDIVVPVAPPPPVDQPPVAVNDNVSTTENHVLTIAPATLLSNDTDPEHDPLNITSVQAANNGSVALVDGSVVFTPKADYVGDASFTYTISDGHGGNSTATVDVTVNPPGLSAVAATGTVHEAGLLTGSHSGDVTNDPVTIIGTLHASETGNTEGTGFTYALVPDGANHPGTLTINENGSYSYTLNGATSADANGDTFTYRVTDAVGNTTTSTVTVTIVDDKPTANPDTNADLPGQSVTGNVITGTGDAAAGADTQGADRPVTVTAVTGGTGTPEQTSITGADTATTGYQVVTADGTLKLYQDGHYTYDAKPNVTGTDTFNYTITDADDNTSSTTLTITVSSVGLFANAATGGTVYEAGLPFGSASGVDPTVAIGTLVAGETGNSTPGFTYALTTGDADSATHYGTLEISTGGSYTYTLSGPTGADAGGSVSDIFTYQVTDAAHNTTTSTVTVTIIDDKPTAVLDTASVFEGVNLTTAASVLANDTPLSVDSGVSVVAIAAGTTVASSSNVTVGTPDVIHTSLGTLTMYSDGHYTYQADANVTAGSVDTFTYTMQDGDGTPAHAQLQITVTDAGLATQGQAGTVYESGLSTGSAPLDTTHSASFTGSLTTAETSGIGGYQYTLVGNQPALGTVTFDNTNNTYTYKLNGATSTDSAGTVSDQFTYQVKDAAGNVTQNTVNVTVHDDAPIAQADNVTVTGTSSSFNFVFMIDRSSSMDNNADGSSGTGGASRLDVAKASLINLLNSVTVNQVMVVDFGSTASHNTEGTSVWTSKADAISYIQSLTTNGSTNYDAALAEVTGHWGAGPTAATQTVSYFLSDGAPNQPNGSVGISSSESTAWDTFVSGHGVVASFAIGVGSDVTTSTLNPIAYPNTSANTIVVTDATQLESSISATLLLVPAHGNVVTNDTAGADGVGTHVVSVTYDTDGNGSLTATTTTTVSYDPNHPTQSTHIDLGTGRGSLDIAADGTYTYTPPTSAAGGTFTAQYTIQDGDGTQSIGTMTFSLPTTQSTPPAENVAPTTDNVTASGAEGAASISIALHGADTDGSVASFKITSLPENGTLYSDSAHQHAIVVGGTVASTDGSHATVYFDPTPNFNGSSAFQYAAIDNLGLIDQTSATATITVTPDAPVVAHADTIVTAVHDDAVFTVPDWALLQNDTAGHDGAPILASVSKDVANAALDVVSLSSGIVSVDTDSTFHTGASTSFSYIANDGSMNSNGSATVNVIASDANIDRHSSTGDEILIGTSGGHTIQAGSGNDILFAGSGNDTLIGGHGNDTMTGGVGVDVFKWNLGDQGTSSSPAADVITNFRVGSGGDVLDLRDLLSGEHSQTQNGQNGHSANLDHYLQFADEGGKAVLLIDSSGSNNGNGNDNGNSSSFHADQTITFNNYSSVSALANALLGSGSHSDADIIAKMIANGNLKTDV